MLKERTYYIGQEQSGNHSEEYYDARAMLSIDPCGQIGGQKDKRVGKGADGSMQSKKAKWYLHGIVTEYYDEYMEKPKLF